MADTRYWFARYRPSPVASQQGRGIVPISWQGRAVIGGFVAGMIVGGISLLYFGLQDQFLPGIVCFVVLAVAGAGTFLWAGVTKSDPVKSVADYRAERAK